MRCHNDLTPSGDKPSETAREGFEIVMFVRQVLTRFSMQPNRTSLFMGIVSVLVWIKVI